MLLVSDSILGKLYTYTPDGIRSSKTVNGTKTEYLLNGTQILAQKTGSDVMWFFYDSTGTRIGVQQGNVTAYYMYNLQGDVVGLADAATGKIIAKYLYDAWGKCVSVENADGYTIGTANPFRYRGYYYDNDTGLYYLQSRYYDPAIGRFINADTYTTTDADGILSSNMFAYCENNPVNRSDPNGEWVHVLVGGLIGAATSYISARICGATPKEALESAAWGAASGALSAALPGAGALIDVGMNVAESVVSDCVDGKDAGTVVSNAFISATIGAVTGSRNSYITSSQTWKNIGKVTQSFSKIVKGNHPKIKALNKKFSKKVFKKASKSLALDFLSEISAGIVGKYAKF